MKKLPRRNRFLYAALIVGTILLGLATRWHNLLSPWLSKSSGDILWALCVYLVFALLSPAASIRQIALRALLFACLIEFGLLYHAPWIDVIRHQRVLGLILGQQFHWINFPCYFVGIGVGMVGECSWWRQTGVKVLK